MPEAAQQPTRQGKLQGYNHQFSKLNKNIAQGSGFFLFVLFFPPSD